MYQAHKVVIDLNDGRTIEIETGKLAKQAHGSVVVRMGNTMLLATVVSADTAKEDVDFLPLTVEYQEKYAAAGRFPGGFTRREGKPSDHEILTARLIDRALRPLFPWDYHADTYVIVQLISADKENQPDALAGLAASAAIMVSDIPFDGPMAEVRVARIDGKFVINPGTTENNRADLDIMVAASADSIVMVEGEMDEVSEADMLAALRLAHESIKKLCNAQNELVKLAGKTKRTYSHEVNDEDLRKRMHEATYQKFFETACTGTASKKQRGEAFGKIREEFVATLPTDPAPNKAMIARYFAHIEEEAVRNAVIDKGIRLDGRKTTDIRPIWSEVDYLPGAHGSAIFTRGETQSLTTVTLGSADDAKMVDDALFQGDETFLLHYNFPPFSTGDAKPFRGTGRREVGHGNLALRALKRMLPTKPENPYTIRVVSDILESNGSSSMATVCAGTLALMDAGVKIKRPVSGIAMGLLSRADGKFAVLSDILGDEDHLGDMDFKVTGTERGITACQMDIKIKGLSFEVISIAMEQARAGRHHILGKMMETMNQPREDYKPHAPRIEAIEIPKDFIGAIIGPGGKVIQKIQADTGTTINIEEIDNIGRVSVASPNKAGIDAAMARIKGIVEQPEEGKTYHGKVKTITEFGAFVEILPGKDGLLHVSEMDWKRVDKVTDVVKEGDMIDVKALEIDKRSGKIRLSRKALLEKPEGYVERPASENHGERHGGGDRRHGGGGDRRHGGGGGGHRH